MLENTTLNGGLRRSLCGLAVLFAAFAAGCGGGGGDDVAATPAPGPAPAPAPGPAPAPAPAPAPGVAGTAEGLWSEGSSGGVRYILVEADGQLWGIPSASPFGNGASNFGATKGNITASSGSVSGTYNDVATTACSYVSLGYTCTVSGLSTSAQLAISGVQKISGASNAQGWNFTGKPEASYLAPANASQVAGTWNMEALYPGNFSAAGTLSISSAGAVTAASIGSCAFAGTITPVAGKGYFRLALSTVSGTCATGTTAAQVTGVVYQTTITGRPPVLHVNWHGATVSQYFWSSGSK